MKCSDGTRHVWHFFVRLGAEFRACKKCSHVEMKTTNGYTVVATRDR